MSSQSVGRSKVSEHFCALDSDLAVKSSDDVLFKVHKLNLQIAAGNFPLTGDGSDPTISLKDTSATLDLLFRFCYPELHPDLENVDFGILKDLAEAVENYQVWSALNICKIRMRDNLGTDANAFDIMIYGATHKYPDVVDLAAPVVVRETSLVRAVECLPPEIAASWALYVHRWDTLSRDLAKYYMSPDARFFGSEKSFRCEACKQSHHRSYDNSRYCNFSFDILEQLVKEGTMFLGKLDGVLKSDSYLCLPRLRRFVSEGAKKIPAFSGFTSATVEWFNHGMRLAHSIPTDAVEFYSEDNSEITFKVEKTSLWILSGGFPPPEFQSRKEPITLSECHKILDLLFQFFIQARHPNLEPLGFDLIAELAEAAEKYHVYAAMTICKILMKKAAALPQNAGAVLAYATEHRYRDIYHVAASTLVLRENLSETLPKLPQHLMIPWVKYYELVHPESLQADKKTNAALPTFEPSGNYERPSLPG